MKKKEKLTRSEQQLLQDNLRHQRFLASSVSVMKGSGASIKVMVPNTKVDPKIAKYIQASASALKGWSRYADLPLLADYANLFFSALPKQYLKRHQSEGDEQQLSAASELRSSFSSKAMKNARSSNGDLLGDVLSSDGPLTQLQQKRNLSSSASQFSNSPRTAADIYRDGEWDDSDQRTQQHQHIQDDSDEDLFSYADKKKKKSRQALELKNKKKEISHASPSLPTATTTAAMANTKTMSQSNTNPSKERKNFAENGKSNKIVDKEKQHSKKESTLTPQRVDGTYAKNPTSLAENSSKASVKRKQGDNNTSSRLRNQYEGNDSDSDDDHNGMYVYDDDFPNPKKRQSSSTSQSSRTSTSAAAASTPSSSNANTLVSTHRSSVDAEMDEVLAIALSHDLRTRYNAILFPKQAYHSFLEIVDIGACGVLKEPDEADACVEVIL